MRNKQTQWPHPIKRVLISGASGFLGRHLIEGMSNMEFELYSIGFGHKELGTGLTYYDCNNYQFEELPWEKFDAVIHCAFARNEQGDQLVSSLRYGIKIAEFSVKGNIPAFINISSQSVYGRSQPAPWTEDTPVAPGPPDALYGLAKWSFEEILRLICNNTPTRAVSLRMGSLSGIGLNTRMTARFVKQAAEGQNIAVRGGQWRVSYLDVRDAVDGIIALLRSPIQKWDGIYNFGNEKTYSILQIAQKAVEMVNYAYGTNFCVTVNDPDERAETGMHCGRFYKLTGWQPKYDIEDMIKVFIENVVDNCP